MKKITLLSAMVLLILSTFSGCGSTKPKYCAVSGCPSETSPAGSPYCTIHKCANTSCKNRGSMTDSFSYCTECISRAN